MTLSSPRRFLELLNVDQPVIQAPMAGTSTPAMAAAVSNAGGLGSLGVGSVSAKAAGKMIADMRARTPHALNVNVFCHRPATADPGREAAWLQHLAPNFMQFDAVPPPAIGEIYKSFLEDEDMFRLMLVTKPRVVSFHFGLPRAEWIAALRAAGIILFASATNLRDARAIAAAGVDAVVAQGYEAGGHRGLFETEETDDRLGTVALVRLLVRELDLPVIAAGGIMDGAGVAAMLRLGASAAQLGTAFVATEESAADAGYRAALFSEAAFHTVMTRAISGRPARCLANRFTALGANMRNDEIPDYPIAYDAGKALNAAAKAKGDFSYGAQWAGQGAPLARAMPVEKLMRALIAEIAAA